MRRSHRRAAPLLKARERPPLQVQTDCKPDDCDGGELEREHRVSQIYGQRNKEEARQRRRGATRGHAKSSVHVPGS